MPRLFITGICGFIGRHIATEAMRQGFEVSGCDRRPIKIDGASIHKADVRDKKAMLKLTKKADSIIHLAAVTSNLEFEKKMPYCYEVNVNGTNNIFEAAFENGCEKLLYASSSAVYADKFSEDAAIDIGGMKNHYAKTKLMNEAVGKSYRSQGLLDAVGMRFFNVYGAWENDKGNYASIVSLFMKQKKAGMISIYGDGKQARDLIHADDVAKIALLLLRKGRKEVYNVGTGKATSYNEIADLVGGNRTYVKNPLSTYQLLTKADTKRLLDDIGNFTFVDVKEGIARLASGNRMLQ